MSLLRQVLLATSLIPLAACGADDVASPGEGVIVVPAPTPTPTPTPTPNPTPGQAAAACPQGGYIDRGVVTNATTNQSFRNCEISGRISADLTIQRVPGVAYSLSGPVNVGTDVGGDGQLAGGDPTTLTIQPGTLIFASSGNDYLVVNRGSRLIAQGTAAQPIIFTARANVEGTATDSSQGLWGGIILLGRAPISDCNTQVPGGSAGCQQVIEGTTGSLYGGNQPNDNSGIVQFVQIRYSGFQIAPGNELQSLTTGGVGSGTTIDHVHSHNSSDDGVEFFGGRHNVKYLAVTGADDDSIDSDLGYRGTIQFVAAAHRDSSNGDSMIEADSNGNEEALPRQYTRISNATLIQRGTTQGGNAILLRGGTDYALLNSIVIGPQACIDLDETGGTTSRTTTSADLQENGAPVFRSVLLSCPTPFRSDNNVSPDAIAMIFGSGTNNNNSSYTPSLTATFVPGANEAVAATDPTPFNTDPFFTANAAAPNRLETVTFIGALRNAQDTSFQGWTCNAGYASFGGSGGACTAVPTII